MKEQKFSIADFYGSDPADRIQQMMTDVVDYAVSTHEFYHKYNPWWYLQTDGEGDHSKAVELNNQLKEQWRNCSDDFSMINRYDEKYIDIKNSHNTVQYGLPIHVTGDVEDGQVNMVMFNSRHDGADLEKDTSLEKYRDGRDINWDEYTADQAFYNHIMRKNTNLDDEFNTFCDSNAQTMGYFMKFFRPLLTTKSEGYTKAHVEQFAPQGKTAAHHLSLSNIELVPYRSKNISDIKFNKEYDLIDLPTVQFGIGLILKRICLSIANGDNEAQKPLFIFRFKKPLLKFIEFASRFVASQDQVNDSISLADILDYVYLYPNQRATFKSAGLYSLKAIREKVFNEVHDKDASVAFIMNPFLSDIVSRGNDNPDAKAKVKQYADEHSGLIEPDDFTKNQLKVKNDDLGLYKQLGFGIDGTGKWESWFK